MFPLVRVIYFERGDSNLERKRILEISENMIKGGYERELVYFRAHSPLQGPQYLSFGAQDDCGLRDQIGRKAKSNSYTAFSVFSFSPPLPVFSFLSKAFPKPLASLPFLPLRKPLASLTFLPLPKLSASFLNLHWVSAPHQQRQEILGPGSSFSARSFAAIPEFRLQMRRRIEREVRPDAPTSFLTASLTETTVAVSTLPVLTITSFGALLPPFRALALLLYFVGSPQCVQKEISLNNFVPQSSQKNLEKIKKKKGRRQKGRSTPCLRPSQLMVGRKKYQMWEFGIQGMQLLSSGI